MLKRILAGLYHFNWYTFIVLNAAVLVVVVRLALPEIGNYKDEIQSWISEYMGHPVVIDEISTKWQGWTPQLYLSKIDLYTPDNTTLIGRFDSVHLSIDLIASLNKRELVPSQLSISGLNLKFTRNTDGSISVDNGENNNLNNNSNNTALSEWLLKQKHITLENANLIWHDKKTSEEKQQFSNVQLELKTRDDRVQVGVVLPLPEEYGQSLIIRMDVLGNILTPDWKGTVYAEAKNVNPTKLLEDSPIKSMGGIANAKLWSNWNKAKLIEISGEIHYSDFSLNTDQYNLSISNANLNLHGIRKPDKDWLLNITVEELQTSNGLWPASSYQLDIIKNESGHDYRYMGQLSYLKLEDVIPFLVAANIISNSALDKIHWPSLKGEVTNTSFNYDPESETEEIILLNTSFNDLELISNDEGHAVNGLQGSISASNKFARLKINSNYSKLSLESILEQPLQITAINAEFELINNDSIDFLINEFHFEDKNISLRTSGEIKFYKDVSPFIDIIIHIDKTNIQNLPDYLPKQISTELRDWFIHSLVGGELLSGDLIYRGYSADFPFKKSEGIFKTILNVENATLDYSEGWPPIDNITAKVIIDNDDLFISSKTAYVFDATINDFTANIKEMGSDNPHLIISGSVTGHTRDAGHFITQSPLNENPSLSELTENISGRINLKLNLDIPVNQGETAVDGLISFTDTTIESGLPGLGLESVNGDVNFTTLATWGSNIDALYHGIPVKLDIPKFDQSDSESYVISGMAKKDFFINELISFFPSLSYMNNNIGDNFIEESKWFLSLRKSTSVANTDSREVEFNSDLQGITINLPFPIGKTAKENRPLSIKTKLSGLLIDEININYDNTIYADLKVDNTNDLIIENVLIGLGQQHPSTPITNDISIQGELEELNISDWIDFINPKRASAPQNNNSNNQKKVNGNIYINRFNMLGNKFNNLNINLSNHLDSWQILFDSKQLKGEAIFSISDNKHLYAKFEKLVLSATGNNQDKDKSQIAIDKIPELDVNVDEFIYNDNKLGKLSLLTSNIDNGINIDNLSIMKPGFSIQAKGKWVRLDEVDRSDFHATLEVNSIETMLSTFNFNSTSIKEGKTSIEMNAFWMGTPMNFAMEKIDGEINMNIDKGQFSSIDPSAGRLFGLLSLQALPRRLTLDFTDIFNEGFTFDSIKGNFSLQQGHAYTNNLEMTGPAADIIVSGRTGLSAEDYDQIATVTPKISSGLPVASALFGPVGVGVGAVIYLAGELFESIPRKIDQILSHQYTITGSWDHPNVEEVKEEKESS